MSNQAIYRGDQLRCPHCDRPYPQTALDLWMQRNGMSYSLLCRCLTEMLGRKIDKNMLYRFNHQHPDWKPRTRSQREFQQAVLDVTGLAAEDLKNEKPSGGYSMPQITRRSKGVSG